jgi:hypothetical protein
MIVLSPALFLEQSPQIRLTTPIILWHSLVTRDSLTVSSEDENYPADNLATDSMAEFWKAANTSPVTIEVAVAGEEIDAVGIARHNLGSSHASITIEALVSVDGGPDEWVEVIPEQMLADNSPALFRFAPIFATTVRLTIEGGTVAASAAVMYVGKLLVMPKGITAGHVPLDHAVETQVVNGRSEAGAYLGRIITGQSASTSVQFSALPIDWFYDVMAGFVNRGMAGPFFFAWLPMSRPNDVGFAWLNADPRPSLGSVFVDVTLDIGGVTW